MSYIWNIVLHQPLLNALAFLVSIIPGGNVGLAIIVLTIVVKIILFPISQKAIKNQTAISMMAPELDKIKKSGANKEEQARLTFELYKKHKVNPLSGCLLQIPVLLVLVALYSVFLKGLKFDGVLYSFIHVPTHINMVFLWFDVSKPSIFLAILAGISQYLVAKFTPMPKIQTPSSGSMSFQDSFTKSMSTQTKYMFPLMIVALTVVLHLPAAAPLYYIVSNLFTVGQQIYVNKTEEKELDQEVLKLEAQDITNRK